MSVCETCGALGGLHKTSCAGPVMNEVGKPKRWARPNPAMHFMRGKIAGILQTLVMMMPSDADVTITETRDAAGRKTLTITATWEEEKGQ